MINPYIFYFKKINTDNLLNFSFPKIIPQIDSNSIEEICKIDQRLPNDYNYESCAQIYYGNICTNFFL